ncbi:MAG: DMT family transporter [Gammaproteobacteria bacterium]|nr:DMT family transporter [Gammaproteobacteria bacterium]
MNSRFKINTLLVLVAFIWGFGFIPQKLGMNYVGPAAFNALRFALGAATLLPLIFFLRARQRAEFDQKVTQSTIAVGVVLGALLFFGALFQQMALLYTSVANVAFITGLYVILVPVIGFFLGVRYAAIVWAGGLLAIVGLYLMTGGGQASALKGDLIALIGALAWAVHIMVLSRRSGDHQQVALAAYQFAFCAIFSLLFALIVEPNVLPETIEGYLWPLVNGVIVVGVGYTIQVLVMDRAEPFQASLIFSLEAVFGAIAGYWIFDESFTIAALIGAMLMLIGCILAQSPSAENSSP